jgi:hypothetical protein
MHRCFAAAALLLGLLPPIRATAATFTIEMVGEAPGPAIATLVLDGPSDSVSWSFSVPLDALPITAAAIYRDTGGQADPLVIELPGLVGGPQVDADVDAVLLYPTLYYVELANNAYPQGAFAGALPEPGTLGMLAVGLASVALLRRRISARA